MVDTIDKNIAEAREALARFETTEVAHGSSTINHIVRTIRDNLVKAGVDAAALDATGKSTAKDMEGRIEKAAARAHLTAARTEFARFETTDASYDAGTIDHIAQTIREHLAKAGVDAAALDATSKSTAEDMESRIEKAAARAHLTAARTEFARFETTDVSHSANTIAFIAKTIRAHFAKAGADASALDPTGKSSAATMEARIDRAVERAKELTNEGGPV
jgi:citrate lyase gamma subunit